MVPYMASERGDDGDRSIRSALHGDLVDDDGGDDVSHCRANGPRPSDSRAQAWRRKNPEHCVCRRLPECLDRNWICSISRLAHFPGDRTASHSRWLEVGAGAALVLAGLYQFTSTGQSSVQKWSFPRACSTSARSGRVSGELGSYMGVPSRSCTTGGCARLSPSCCRPRPTKRRRSS